MADPRLTFATLPLCAERDAKHSGCSGEAVIAVLMEKANNDTIRTRVTNVRESKVQSTGT